MSLGGWETRGCGYCGRYMRRVDYGPEFGVEWVCSQQAKHIAADPKHWSIGTLDVAVQVAKIRAGLDPDLLAQPSDFIDHMDADWRQPFWQRQMDRVLEAELTDALSQVVGIEDANT